MLVRTDFLRRTNPSQCQQNEIGLYAVFKPANAEVSGAMRLGDGPSSSRLCLLTSESSCAKEHRSMTTTRPVSRLSARADLPPEAKTHVRRVGSAIAEAVGTFLMESG